MGEAEARSRERYRRAALAGVASAAGRGVNILAVFVSIPVTLKYLGVERFSAWMTITSLAALLAFADFGLGNGLMNAVTRLEAQGERDQLRGYVATALVVLGGLATLLAVFAVLAAPYVPWGYLLAVDPRGVSTSELNGAMCAFLVCVALGLPTTVIQRVQLGLQLGYQASLWQLAGTAAGLLALLAAVVSGASLAWLILAWLGTPSVVLAVSAWFFWNHQRPEFRPALSLARVPHARELAVTGFLFFLVQVGAALAYASDNVIIAHVLGAGAVAQYSVASRLFEGIVMMSTLLVTPLWPAYADAHARGDAAWIKRALVRSLGLTALGTAVLSVLLVAAGNPLLSVWLGKTVPYSFALFAGCAAWAIVKATGGALAMFMNGLGWIGMQAVLAPIFACAAVAAKVVLAQRLGTIGIPLALLATYVVTMVVPYAWHIPKLIARLDP